MTLTSRVFSPEETKQMAEQTKVIRITRGVCIEAEDDAAEGEVRRVSARIAQMLVGEGSAVEATAEDLEAYQKSKAEAAKKGDSKSKG